MSSCPLKEDFECKEPEILCKEAPCFCPLICTENEIDLLRLEFRHKKGATA